MDANSANSPNANGEAVQSIQNPKVYCGHSKVLPADLVILVEHGALGTRPLAVRLETWGVVRSGQTTHPARAVGKTVPLRECVMRQQR